MPFPLQDRKNDPHQEATSNSPGVTYFTCPACYTDLDDDEGESTCPGCGSTVDCQIEMVAVYEATLVTED